MVVLITPRNAIASNNAMGCAITSTYNDEILQRSSFLHPHSFC